MKSSINLPECPPEYPCLKISTRGNGLIVLFTAPKTGTVVYAGQDNLHTIGIFLSMWDDDFIPFAGEVTLSN